MKFASIQMLRAIAANIVVISHLHGIEGKYGKGFVVLPEWTGAAGPAGVHLFFVISGFVMVFAMSDQSWRDFFLARIARIYPIYWFYTSLIVLLILLIPKSISFSLPSYSSILKSYLLFPDTESPLLTVGWSLVFEMYFYAVLTVLIAFTIPIRWAFPIWAILLVVLMSVFTPSSPVETLVLSPLTLEFLAGGMIGILIKRDTTIGAKSALAIGIVTLIVGFMRYGPYAQPTDSVLLSVCLLGLPFTLIVYGCTAMEISGHRFSFPLALLLGDASYSIYLCHSIVLSALGRVFMAVPMAGLFAETCFVLACLIAVNCIGVMSHFWLEKVSSRHLRNWFGLSASRIKPT